jgi:glycosyltransferase involved in cell wall biosynthesis
MRIGASPTKFGAVPRPPEPVTVAIVTYIPFQAGYFEERLAILKLCLASLAANTLQPFDLLVFDNGSCSETVEYLTEARASGRIQYLILGSQNVGQVGAWNFIFGAAPSEYIVYSDSDVYFYPGWLAEEMKVLQAFENVGMVSGLPAMNGFGMFTRSTLLLAENDPETRIERGQLMPDEWITDWGQSTGQDPAAFLAQCRQIEQVRLTRRGVVAYAVGAHFQFLARAAELRKVTPLPNTRLAGITRTLDQRLDEAGYARLAVSRPLVYHLGNVLTPRWKAEAERLGVAVPAASQPEPGTFARRLAHNRVIRRLIIELYRAASRAMMYAH